MNFGVENETVEFKESLAQEKEGIISLVAMLNKHGCGTVYFGVNDAGELIGLREVGKKTIRSISQKISDNVVPKIIASIEILEEEGKHYIVLKASGEETPYSYNGDYRIRSADQDKKFPRELLRRYFNSGSKDIIVAMESYYQDFHFTQLQAMLLSRGVKIGNEKTFLRNEGLVNREGKFNVQASLLADESNFSIKVSQFASEDKSNLLKRTEFGYQSLALAIEQVSNYIQSMNETRTLVGGSTAREETQLFDFDCFREAWINASLHTRWEEGTPPIVFVFNNRIEVLSYGGLPLGLSEDDFYLGRQKVINESLLKIFAQLNFAETTGYGVPLIVRKYGKEAFEISNNFIQVTIPFAWAMNAERTVAKVKLTDNEKKVMELLKQKPSMTRSELVESSGISEGGIVYALNNLRKKGLISRKGARKNGYWAVIE